MEEPKSELPARRVNGRMWQPGESGNAGGRPIGARGRFSQRFIADLTNAWEQYGADALAKTAQDYPDRFVGICSHLIPKDVQVSLTTQLPAGLDQRRLGRDRRRRARRQGATELARSQARNRR